MPAQLPDLCVTYPLRRGSTVSRLLALTEGGRVLWRGVDLDLTNGEYRVFKRLIDGNGDFVSYRDLYDVMQSPGFIGGPGANGYRGNVRSIVKRIRSKFKVRDPNFKMIRNYTGFGYAWREH